MKMKHLKLDAIHQAEAKDILIAKQKEESIHSTGDIKAAGEEVERKVREVIAGWLPARYRTIHGHILDYTCQVSPQLDIIVTENLSNKSLFATSDGTEYAPFESVYAIGEIKSTYYKSDKPIQSFSSTVSTIQTDLTRLKSAKHPILNFMVFVSSNDFSFEDIEAFYLGTPIAQLPSLVCLLDKGTILYGRFPLNGRNEPVFTTYYICPATDSKGDKNDRWSLIYWCDEAKRTGGNLMFLHLALSQHLQRCIAPILNLDLYLMHSLKWETCYILEP
jgi:hypothetical protein